MNQGGINSANTGQDGTPFVGAVWHGLTLGNLPPLFLEAGFEGVAHFDAQESSVLMMTALLLGYS